jgi:two-component system phosphate regulon sensor histidine kinase PhoR
MWRWSARTIIVVPWMVATAGALTVGRVPWGTSVLVSFFSLLLAIVVANHIANILRSLSHELRAHSTVADIPTAFLELNELRTTIRKLRDDAELRAGAAASAERRFISVLESITEGILQVNASGRFVHANAAAREMLNLPSDLAGQPIAALIRQPELRASIEQAAGGHSFEPLEIVLDERHLLVSPHRYRRDSLDQVSSGAVVAVVDLTEYRRLESVRRDFVANVSHELKTPLTSIRGYTETLLSDDVPEETRHQFLEVIRKNTNRIQRIVDDLLDLSRLQSGGWRPELQDVNVDELARDVWAGCEAGHRKQIAFDVQAGDHPQVLADPGGLRQILSNLFDNAIRYTPVGGRIHVGIRPTVNNGKVMIEVVDNGAGIPRDALPRVFERFYRADNARSRIEGGTGLGLSIVKHLVERMDGEVAADSELGKGTTIRFTLPSTHA